MNLSEVQIISKTEISESVFTIEFKRNFKFQAGQIIGVTNNTALAPRLYSICSSPNEANVRILFNVKADGELTPPLSEVNIDDAIYITPVQGKFIYNNEPAWWIATGTGIAPFYSMFKSGQKPLKLIQGGRTVNDFYFQDELSMIPGYIRCSSQQNADGYYNGRLTKYLEDFEKLPTDINYYLCGSAEMVVDVRNLLINKGVPFNHIITEIYF